MSDVIDALKNRVSSPKLGDPGPNSQELEQILWCGAQAPDHGRLRPWRFVVIQGSGLERLGQVFVAAKESDSEQPLDERVRQKLASMPLRAPLIIVAIAHPQTSTKIPRHEQLLAVGAAVQNMQLAARALGYGAMWRTGEMAEHLQVKQALGFSSDDEIVAFLYVGKPMSPDRPRAPNPISDCVSYWS